ncbi:MAG: cupin domain-containing protein, partial [Subdoligranulum sp.]|nr:cupin domain-containing protein [Subdoligranulum sp.]
MNTRYEFNMDVPPREAIRLLYVSKSRFGGDWNSVPHTHSCTEVFYCVDGRGQFNVEGKMLDVAPDDMVIVNPRTLHTELSYQANPLEYVVLGIEGIEILFEQKDRGYTMLKCSSVREELLSLM